MDQVPDHPRRRLLTRLLLFAVAMGVAAAATASNDTPAHAQPALTPSPGPTAQASPELRSADELARQGKVDEAVEAYQGVIESGSASERLAARLALGRLYIGDGEEGQAVGELDAYLVEAPAGSDVRAAQYLLAEALALQGDDEGALPLYEAYIAGGGGASTYARLGRAAALARLSRPEASAEAETALRADLPDSFRLPFVLEMAQALEENAPNDALTWYSRLQQESVSPADRALAIWRSAVIRDVESSVALTIIQQYPQTPTALEVAENFPGFKGGISEYYFAIVYYHNGEDDKAREIFERQVQAPGVGSDAARASYYLAVLDERAGDFEAAISGYGRVLALEPTVELADDALWWQGRLLEQAGRHDEAASAYRRLASQYSGSDFAPEASFRLALLDYKRRRFDEAASAFAALSHQSREEDRWRALLWQGKALEAAGRSPQALALWQRLREESPREYYGLRARVLVDGGDGRLRRSLQEADPPDWAALKTWLNEQTTEDSSQALEMLLFDQHWGLGQELLALGMRRRAADEFAMVLDEAGSDPQALFQLTRFFHTIRLDDLSSRAATRLLDALSDDARDQAPDDLWRLAYPAAYPEVVDEAAGSEDVPASLLLGVMRQESFFDPLAGSSAGALGLMQVIPPTGEAIADDLGLTDFQTDHLFRPATSVTFGAHYLREQLDAFDGNVYRALAAYNGGPGSARRWRTASGDDVDLFVEEIEFSQTKAYVRLVMENLARYRQLYQGLDEPALPAEEGSAR